MTKTTRILDVFVASPSDVAPERDRLEDVIREMNRSWRDALNVRMELYRWETEAYPGVGADAQEVINREFPKKYDIFIGILWSRIGTPTKRAESGTVEEYEKAYEQWQADKDSIEILMYFKNAPVDFDKIDPSQIQKVKEFQERFQKIGLPGEFRTTDQFEKLVRNHLTRVIHRLGGGIPQASGSTVRAEQEQVPDQQDDELGLLDAVERWEDGMTVVQDITHKFTDSMEDIGEYMSSSTSELTGLNMPDGPKRNREIRRIVNAMANRFETFAALFNAEVPVYEEAFDMSLSGLEETIQVTPDFGSEHIDGLVSIKPTLTSFMQSMGDARSGVQEFQEMLKELP